MVDPKTNQPMQAGIFFASGSSDVTASAKALDEIAGELQRSPSITQVAIVGMADASESYPTTLAKKRATAVHKALVARMSP